MEEEYKEIFNRIIFMGDFCVGIQIINLFLLIGIIIYSVNTNNQNLLRIKSLLNKLKYKRNNNKNTNKNNNNNKNNNKNNKNNNNKNNNKNNKNTNNNTKNNKNTNNNNKSNRGNPFKIVAHCGSYPPVEPLNIYDKKEDQQVNVEETN